MNPMACSRLGSLYSSASTLEIVRLEQAECRALHGSVHVWGRRDSESGRCAEMAGGVFGKAPLASLDMSKGFDWQLFKGGGLR